MYDIPALVIAALVVVTLLLCALVVKIIAERDSL